MASRFHIEGASVQHLEAALETMLQALGNLEAGPPRASALSSPMRELIDVCVKMTSARHFKSEARNPRSVRAGETHMTPVLRRRTLQVADRLLICIVQNYERSGAMAAAAAAAEKPVNFQNYCTDERLIGETPTTLLMMVRWHLFFVCYDMHTMSEHDARGETWQSAEARPLGARTLPSIDNETLARARLCATRRTWAEWRQSDVRDIVDVLARRRAHISSLRTLYAVETALLWVEQRMALFALASHTAHTFDLGDNPFQRGDRARSRTALAGSAQSPLYAPSREFNAHIAHCLIELYIPWLETEVKGMLDQRKFRDRVLPTTVHLEFRAGELHDFARHFNGYVMPKRTKAVLQKMRTTAQITELLETIIKRPIPELLTHARPTVRTSTMLHAFDVMCDQHTQLLWKAHACLFESDFFGEHALLYEHPTPVLVQLAGCFSVLFRAHFYHCADLVEALATWTHIVVNVLDSEFVVGLQRYSLAFMQQWLLQWRRMGRLYLEKNPHQQHGYDPKFEPRLRVAPALRDWFGTHWARMAQQEHQEEMMRDMAPGFEPVD